MKRNKFTTMVKGLLSGDLRHWGAAQYQQYVRFLGRAQKVGIEIEVNLKPNEDYLDELKKNGFGISWTRYDSFEITYLFDVTDPRVLRDNVSKAMRVLDKYKIPKIGALHLNYQIENGKRRKKTETLIDYCKTGKYGIKELLTEGWRVECKLGSAFLYDEELIVQMLLGYVGIYGLADTLKTLADCTQRIMIDLCPRHIINPAKQADVMLETLDKPSLITN